MKKWISTGLAFGMAIILPWMADAQTPSSSGGAHEPGSKLSSTEHSGTHAGKGHHRHQRAKREARLASLRSKQISGSLSDREQKQLARLERWNANRGQKQRHHAKEG
jgi:hypothetical protein